MDSALVNYQDKRAVVSIRKACWTVRLWVREFIHGKWVEHVVSSRIDGEANANSTADPRFLGHQWSRSECVDVKWEYK